MQITNPEIAQPELAQEELALARAVLYRFASDLFRHPDPNRDQDWNVRVSGVRSALELCGDAHDQVRTCLDDLSAARPDHERIVLDHARLFGHTPRASATPYETEWSGAAGNLLQFHLLADIAAFYKAFGLGLARTCDERQDHIAIELSFLHFLCVKEAWAVENGKRELAEISRAAQARFQSEHLARWSPAFCARLARGDGRGFYGCAARFVEEWIRADCARLEVTLGEATLGPGETSFVPEDMCMSCEKSSACLSRATIPVVNPGVNDGDD